MDKEFNRMLQAGRREVTEKVQTTSNSMNGRKRAKRENRA